MITLTIDDKRFQRDMKKFHRRSSKGFSKAILYGTLEMKKAAKLKVQSIMRGSKTATGGLLRGIDSKISNRGLTGDVISRAGYSQAVEEGTRPHIIRAKNKRVLAGPYRGRPSGWNVSKSSASMGYATYGKQVRHPGTSARPFMYPGWRAGMRKFEKMMRKAW